MGLSVSHRQSRELVLQSVLRDESLRAAEGTGDSLALVNWVIFGSAVVGRAVGNFSGLILLF